jgi:hypothetical protein
MVSGEKELDLKYICDINETTWDCLITWFFKYQTNNIFTSVFLNLIETVLENCDSSIILEILVRLGLLQKIVDRVKDLYPNTHLLVDNGGDLAAGVLKKLLEMILKYSRVN